MVLLFLVLVLLARERELTLLQENSASKAFVMVTFLE
jgi:hypothetical protein